MKTVFVTVKGQGPVYWMENLNEGVDPSEVDTSMSLFDLEDDGVLDGELNEIPFILEGVEVLYTENEEPVWESDSDGAVDITKKKGKYLLLNDLFKESYKLVSPFYGIQINNCDIAECFMIELQDDEEFDPKKLQLVKSDYEVEFLPFGISAQEIVYDGKVISCYESEGYRDKGYWDGFVYEEDQPFGSGGRSVSYTTLQRVDY